MKKTNLLLISIFLTVASLYANVDYRKSVLHLKTWDNSYFKVILDNRNLGRKTNFHINNLEPGYHSLQVIRFKRNKFGRGILKQVLFNGNIRVPVNSEMIALVKPNRKLKVRTLKKEIECYDRDHYPPQNRCRNNGYGMYNDIISNVKFNRLTNSMHYAYNDYDRLEILEEALYFNKLSTEQVVSLMRLFDYDSNKLKFAKIAYSKTVDKRNYFLVNQEFAYERSVNSLNRYIRLFG